MPQGLPSATIFIWYPHGDCVGHASMYIGNYEVGKRFELSFDPNSPTGLMPNALETSMGADNVHYNTNYVSWWPEGDGSLTNRLTAAPMPGVYKDVAAEGSEPHVVYELYGLNVAAMRECWHKTRDKPDASYQLIRKNCSGIVARVLNAGGANKKLNMLTRMWFSHRAIWTPKRVAMVCNELRNKDLAIKSKAGNCPPKDSKLMGVLGMR